MASGLSGSGVARTYRKGPTDPATPGVRYLTVMWYYLA